jgi:hypothetical protein
MFHSIHGETTVPILNHTNHIDVMEKRRRRLPEKMLSKSLDYSRMYRSLSASTAPQHHPFVRRSLVIDGAGHDNVRNENGNVDANSKDFSDRVGIQLRYVWQFLMYCHRVVVSKSIVSRSTDSPFFLVLHRIRPTSCMQVIY